jgi:hypothetical protein
VWARSETVRNDSTTYSTSLGRRAIRSTPSDGAKISAAEPLLLDLDLVREPFGVEAGDAVLFLPFHRGSFSDENEPRC